MLVHFGQTLTVSEVFGLGRYGEVSLSGAGRLFAPTAVAMPGPPALAVADQNDRSQIVLDDGNNQQNIDPTRYPQGGLSASNTLRIGDTLPGLTGVMSYQFAGYRIQPVGPISFDHSNARPPAPAAVGGNLKVASFNVLNYFNGDGRGGGFSPSRGASSAVEFARQTAKTVSALAALDADIVGLMEVENDATPNSAIETLVAALNAATAPGTYTFIDTGVIGTDEIRQALLYKPAVVTPVGPWQILTNAVDARFRDAKNRPSLAQTFDLNSSGARLTVVVQHLKSKGADCNDVGDPDSGDGQGNCNLTRLGAAMVLVDWLATDPTGSGDPDYLLIGDFNAYTLEDPIDWLTSHGYTNLVQQFGGPGAYSYVFAGASGYFDHALASGSLAAQATGTTAWHVNADEPVVLDYNVEFKTPNQVKTFYGPGAYRSSDHDPLVIGLNLIPPSRSRRRKPRSSMPATNSPRWPRRGAGKHDADKLGKADRDLGKALDPNRWVDAAHLAPKGGERVFVHLKRAVKDLSSLAGDRKARSRRRRCRRRSTTWSRSPHAWPAPRWTTRSRRAARRPRSPRRGTSSRRRKPRAARATPRTRPSATRRRGGRRRGRSGRRKQRLMAGGEAIATAPGRLGIGNLRRGMPPASRTEGGSRRAPYCSDSHMGFSISAARRPCSRSIWDRLKPGRMRFASASEAEASARRSSRARTRAAVTRPTYSVLSRRHAVRAASSASSRRPLRARASA